MSSSLASFGKSYADALKYRCVEKSHVDKNRRLTALDKVISRVKLSKSARNEFAKKVYLGGEGDILGPLIDFSFNEPYGRGRFSDGTHPVLYTAKEAKTALREVSHYMEKLGCSRFEYAIYTVSITCNLVDLRWAEKERAWRMPEEHEACKKVAKTVQSLGFDGVAARSVRDPGGSCCAVFRKDSVLAGSIVNEGAIDLTATHSNV